MAAGSAPNCTLSVVIPSYERGGVLLESLRQLIELQHPADEIIVADQTLEHPAGVEQKLAEMRDAGSIRWLRLTQPSIPHAMNVGLCQATSDRVLFLDDDIDPDPGLVEAHRDATSSHALIAGMVLQPGEVPCEPVAGGGFRFSSNQPALIREFMGGNFSIGRTTAIALGGFDENFIGAAYRFEAEFAFRYCAVHGPICFQPRAIIHHLQLASGGTRSHGHHLHTVKPTHSAGAYYCLLRTRQPGWLLQFLWRPIRSIRTRFHLRHPWRIPPTLLAEVRGMLLALRLAAGKPKYLNVDENAALRASAGR